MIIKVTKKMVSEIQKAFAKIGKVKNYKVEFVKFKNELYQFFVDSNMRSFDYDYNFADGQWVVIKIIYPDDYYALPEYLTTVDLLGIFRKSDKTFDGFMQKIADCVEA